MTDQQLLLGAVAVLLLLMVFVRFIRRLVFLFLRLGIFFGATAVAVGGIAVLMNNETIYEKPGAKPRIARFLTMNSAATSEKGLGSAVCNWEPAPSAPMAAAMPALESKAERRKAGKSKAEATAAAAAATTTASTTGTREGASAEEEDVYPELMTRGFPGISRQKLFELLQRVINALGGWKIVKADARSFTLECVYSTRFFGWNDDVRITITPKSEIELCSRSQTARADSTSLMRWFPGDLGANLGHVKQFYETLEPTMDAVYKEEQEKENARKPH